MSFIGSAMGTLEVIVIALGAGLGLWGSFNLMEGYGWDEAASKTQDTENLPFSAKSVKLRGEPQGGCP